MIPVLCFGQNKKDLIATVNRLKNDSVSLESKIENKVNEIKINENTIALLKQKYERRGRDLKAYRMILIDTISHFENTIRLLKSTAIPDQNFEQTLIDLGYDDVIDGKVLTENINSVDSLLLDDKDKIISDLTGVEAFSALTSLYCKDNPLYNLDVSKNTALTYLECSNNELTNLDVSKNTALTYLGCGDNQLTNLDVSNNTALRVIGCGGNQLTNLDVSKNTALTFLYCMENKLTNLDLSKNTALTILYCRYNQLTSLDLTKNTALNTLDCSYNLLTSLKLNKPPYWSSLECWGNKLDCEALKFKYGFEEEN